MQADQDNFIAGNHAVGDLMALLWQDLSFMSEPREKGEGCKETLIFW